MSFKNAIKILFFKIRVVPSILLYYLICMILIFGAGYGVLRPIMNKFDGLGIFGQINNILGSMFGGNNLLDTLSLIDTMFVDIFGVLTSSVGAAVGMAFFIFVVIGFFARFLFGLSELPLTQLLHSHMSMNAKFGFFHMFVRHIGTSALYQLCRLLFTLPLDVLIGTVLLNIAKLTRVNNMQIPAMFLMTMLLILLFSLRFAAFAAWAPTIATKEVIVDTKRATPPGTVPGTRGNSMNYFKILLTSWRINFRDFGRVFGTMLLTFTLIVAANIFVALFTFLAGLIVTLPASAFLFKIVSMTTFYANTGRRYYIDSETVFTTPIKN